MEKNISLTFHHIGKPVSLQMIQHNKTLSIALYLTCIH